MHIVGIEPDYCAVEAVAMTISPSGSPGRRCHKRFLWSILCSLFVGFFLSRSVIHNVSWLSVNTDLRLEAGLPDFLGTIYQNGEKYTKLPQNIPSSHKIYQMVIK
jgi:hypothetical protein